MKFGFAATHVGFAVLLATACPGGALAQELDTAPQNRFEAAFSHPSSVPTFARPDVTSLLPDAGLAALEQVAEAEPAPAPEAPRRWTSPVTTARASLTKILHELLISPAESAPSEPAAVAQAETATVPSPQPPVPSPETMPAPPVATGSVASAIVPPVRPRLAAQTPAKPGRRIAVTRAAWYQHSGRTASGAKYNPDGLTAAHRTLPLGKRVLVINPSNRKSVVVRINDRVPRTAKIPLDLSRGSARAIGMTGIGTVALYEVE